MRRIARDREPAGPIRHRREEKARHYTGTVAEQHLVAVPGKCAVGGRDLHIPLERADPKRERHDCPNGGTEEEGPEAVAEQGDRVAVSRVDAGLTSRLARALLHQSTPARRCVTTFGDTDEPLDVADDDLLAADHDETSILPGAQHPAHGMQRRAGDFGDLLTSDREIDEDTFIHLAARLGDEAEHGVRHAMLDILRRHLLQSCVGILDALPHHLHDVARESRMTPHKVVPDRHVPGERDAVHERGRGCGIVLAVERFGYAVDVTPGRRNG